MLKIPIGEGPLAADGIGTCYEVEIPGELIITVERHRVPLTSDDNPDEDYRYTLLFIKADGSSYKTLSMTLRESGALMEDWHQEYAQYARHMPPV